jgi:PhnB protein
MAVKPIPEGYHTVTPYLTVTDATALLAFIEKAFDAKNVHAMRGPDGKVNHAELTIGDSHVMLGQARDPASAMKAMLYLYVPDCDAAYQKAVAAGGTPLSEPQTQPYGDRHGAVTDCCGNQWYVATHVEDVSPEEIDRRMNAAQAQ